MTGGRVVHGHRSRQLTTIGLAAATVALLAIGTDATPEQQAHRYGRGLDMNITRNGSQPSSRGPSEYFTGTVHVQSHFQKSAPARVAGAIVTFEPSARTAWHAHPLGQTLIVTSGLGRVQRAGGVIEEIRPGDVLWIEPGEKHWHGASPTTAMTHIAIQEQLEGKVVEWMEHVTDEQYRARSGEQ
jgi:quercetin dioxygenase-like cupin family protein